MHNVVNQTTMEEVYLGAINKFPFLHHVAKMATFDVSEHFGSVFQNGLFAINPGSLEERRRRDNDFSRK